MSDLPTASRLRFDLRDKIVGETDGLDDEELGAIIGMSATGARHLRERRNWELEECALVADALNLILDIEVKKGLR